MARRYEAREFKCEIPGVMTPVAEAYRDGLQQGANFASQPGTSPYEVCVEWDALSTVCVVYLQWGDYDDNGEVIWH
jgi:hypothetical protein